MKRIVEPIRNKKLKRLSNIETGSAVGICANIGIYSIQKIGVAPL